MPMNKPHLEFHKVDMDKGWVTPPGYRDSMCLECANAGVSNPSHW